MIKYNYYPGCSMSTTGREYDQSIDFVNRALRVRFMTIHGWNCCGATAGHAQGKALGDALPARNLALCEQNNPEGVPIVVPCAACFSRLKHASHLINNGGRERLERLVDMPLRGDNEIIGLMDAYYHDDVMEALSKTMTHQFKGMKIACYYGCLLTRPHKVTGAPNTADPTIMEDIMKYTGAETVEWDYKQECCGASRHVDIPKKAAPLLERIYHNARQNGADAIVTACPMCHMNLDMRQKKINKTFKEDFNIPIYFFTELLAVALGADVEEAGIESHFFPASKLVEEHLVPREDA